MNEAFNVFISDSYDEDDLDAAIVSPTHISSHKLMKPSI